MPQKSTKLLLLVLCTLVLFCGQTAGTSTLVYDVRAFGARGDGKTLDTRAINKAIEASRTHILIAWT